MSNLKGEYAFTGTASCLNSLTGGFNANFQPNPTVPPGGQRAYVHSFAVEGIRTFNGDGTGTVKGTSMGITEPPTDGFPPNASSNSFEFKFTYTVLDDGTWTSDQVPGSQTGTFLTGPRTGQTFTVDQQAKITGLISRDKKSLTAATLAPKVEIQTFSNGDVQPRICHRSRSLFKM